VSKHKGKVLLAKLDVDKNQELAMDLQVKSLPSVFGIYKVSKKEGDRRGRKQGRGYGNETIGNHHKSVDVMEQGKLVDMFMGVPQEKQLTAFFDKLLQFSPGDSQPQEEVSE